MSVVERKKGGGPSGTRMQSAAKRAEIIELRLSGQTLEQVAEVVGLTSEGVRYHEQAWLASRQPSSEVTEEQRQKQNALIDALMAKLWPWLAEPELALPATDRLVKLMDRKARLMGLDLERNVSISLQPTAEQWAAYLGWDEQAAEPAAIEGVAVEVQDADA